jgi:pre-mRNA-splicing factor ATP-dependent RNA helicase DHX38/PRP16
LRKLAANEYAGLLAFPGIVPALPIRKDNIRQRVPETPTHTGGLPTAAREALAARLKARNMPTNLAVGGTLALSANTRELRDSRPGEKGLGEFARRGNRGLNREERHQDRGGREERGEGHRGRREDQDRNEPRPKSWNDAPTPRTNRVDREFDGGSMRVPNRGWDETPRTGGRGGPSYRGSGRAWDAPTPRRSAGGRNGSPVADGEDGMHLDAKEWEEEQVRLDRDWYNTYDEGAIVSINACHTYHAPVADK